MSFSFGKNLRVTLFGQSHSEEIGCVIEGLKPGTRIDSEALKTFMKRRQGGQAYSTPRREHDAPHFIAGIGPDGSICEAPLVVTMQNTNVDSKSYDESRYIPRPSHADIVSYLAYEQHEDWRGGGSFSARLTAPLCVAGGIAKQILKEKGIEIDAHILQVGNVYDEKFDSGITFELASRDTTKKSNLKEQLKALHDNDFPCISADSSNKMQELLRKIKADGDSIGASIECVVEGLPLGLGELLDNPNHSTLQLT